MLSFDNTAWNITIFNPYVNITFCTDSCEPLEQICLHRTFSAVVEMQNPDWIDDYGTGALRRETRNLFWVKNEFLIR